MHNLLTPYSSLVTKNPLLAKKYFKQLCVAERGRCGTIPIFSSSNFSYFVTFTMIIILRFNFNIVDVLSSSRNNICNRFEPSPFTTFTIKKILFHEVRKIQQPMDINILHFPLRYRSPNIFGNALAPEWRWFPVYSTQFHRLRKHSSRTSDWSCDDSFHWTSG